MVSRTGFDVTGPVRSFSVIWGELGQREDEEAALLALRDHQSSGEFVSVLGGKEKPPLVVECAGV